MALAFGGGVPRLDVFINEMQHPFSCYTFTQTKLETRRERLTGKLANWKGGEGREEIIMFQKESLAHPTNSGE